ncbi:UPF0764 protein C16orf89 homolog [Acyrthosiphon pisum]|uniref:Uncharacterized protein n=1 Tax=Acyrthosiphon pisum TaxID=7029 RepID=A0A8R2AB31_ACYPI|nr:UPF0764 protein C16orf89 homolog [Acyrthosiphon pisum]|eukprot:XP_003245325.1 PREDICTED: UPF0764 protein C16orf89 homolog [Acyrthosiphon pisum]
MSLQRYAFCVVLLSRALLGCRASQFFTVDEELNTVRDLENRILDLVESTIRYYLRPDVDNENVNLNLMLGVSIMKGQFMSCTEHSRINYNTRFYKMYKLNTMIRNLYVKFYKNNLMDSMRTILDHKLWISPQTLKHKSNITLPAKIWFDEDILAYGDAYFRNISDKCIGQVISSCRVTYECFQLEFQKQFLGYALTHQVLYIHLLKRMKCNNLKHRNVLKEIIQYKCSTIFEEAQNMAKDFEMLDRYKDLFIEQIAVCGMQNMVDFFQPEWFLIIVSSIKHNKCTQHKNNKSSCDSHLTGVSLAALGVYWKFLCYQVNKYGAY